ncbi:MAG TPA: ATP:cob(I)alamin adenosyltransferase [Bacilli bacterium]|jgi:cob(I)alamin adenosyltransferase|nr:ATP:cob(I)alamin adenosyltransferase [Acholeplasmataceae bacterium]HOE77122.1 ATP:cob(I)alamin adenosyltransferase [Bacilli bacterium]HON63719.1 ATP:cob(I)alamin adenosyltransferase [Bacilli bacterium]HOR95420.1 ATP:cob(I)alamin adenosyltransferase [Bacilli bacterium]HPD12424.1 ATP:cob(I)alamin adenosyltransferase [Bacilli bacterium]
MKKNPLKTALVGGETTKTDERINFFGTVDELSCFVMELTHHLKDDKTIQTLKTVVNTLSKIMGKVAGANVDFGESQVNEILALIEKEKAQTIPEKGFVTPGITLLGAKTHIVRAITRRAELAYAQVFAKYQGDELIFSYLNKLSTYFYYLALKFDQQN